MSDNAESVAAKELHPDDEFELDERIYVVLSVTTDLGKVIVRTQVLETGVHADFDFPYDQKVDRTLDAQAPTPRRRSSRGQRT